MYLVERPTCTSNAAIVSYHILLAKGNVLLAILLTKPCLLLTKCGTVQVRGTWYVVRYCTVRVRVRYGTVQYGTVLYNMLRYGMVRYTMSTIQYYSYIYINILIYIYYTIYITHHHTLLMYIPYYMLRYITYIVMKTTFVFKNKPNCLFRF